jgi:hypothetical protein
MSATGNITSAANIAGGNITTAGLMSATGNITSAANIAGGNITTAGQVVATGNVNSLANVNGGNLATTGLITAVGNIGGGNVNAVGLMSATGNITGNYFIGNGSQLTGITSYGNANVAAYLPTYTGNLIALTGNVITTANITGGNLLTSGTAQIAFGPSNAQTDVNLIALTQALIA